MSRIITITSGKGGVGKTNISVNLSLYLADEGFRSCLFDADMGLANADILLGIYPSLSIEDVILKKSPLKDIVIKDYMGIDIIPGSSGIERLADPKPEELDLLINALSELEDYDFLIIDTSAGISKNVVSFCMASSEIILVVTPEPTSLTDAYSLLKVLAINGFNNPVMVAVNQCRNIEVSHLVFTKFKAAVEKYLPLKVLPLGTILTDSRVSEAVKKQKPFINLFPNSNAAKGIKNIGRRLLRREKTEFNEYGVKTFWTRCLKYFKDPLQLTASKEVNKNQGSGKVYEKSFKEQDHGKNPDGMSMVSQQKEPVLNNEIMNKDISNQDIPVILERLAHGISNISWELSAIRGILEKNFISRH